MKKQSFVTGAAILMIANAISKILGAVFKIPLTYILNDDYVIIVISGINPVNTGVPALSLFSFFMK